MIQVTPFASVLLIRRDEGGESLEALENLKRLTQYNMVRV